MDSVNRTVRMVVLAVPGPLAGTAHAAGGGVPTRHRSASSQEPSRTAPRKAPPSTSP